MERQLAAEALAAHETEAKDAASSEAKAAEADVRAGLQREMDLLRRETEAARREVEAARAEDHRDEGAPHPAVKLGISMEVARTAATRPGLTPSLAACQRHYSTSLRK